MIELRNIHKSYGGKELFVNAGFRVNKGEHAGLVGPNGIGKTTIFRIITGEEYADKGAVSTPNNFRISYLKQNLEESDISKTLIDYTSKGAVPELETIPGQIHALESEAAKNPDPENSVRILNRIGELQHQFEALGGYTIRNTAEKALSGLGFSVQDYTRPLSAFSGGWQMRASLARVLISSPDIMLLDEPSNYLDIPAIEWLRKYLKTFEGVLLLISHDRFLLNNLTNVTLEVNGGKITRYEGNYDYYVHERNVRENQIAAARDNQEKKVEQIERFIERFRYKASKASQVQSRIKMLEKFDDIDEMAEIHYTGVINLPPPPQSGFEAIRLENVSFGYDKAKMILSDINLEVKTGEKIAVVGYNGTGKTTLLKLLSGVLKPESGIRRTGHNVIIGYQAQEFSEILESESSVFETISQIVSDKASVRPVLGRFGFSGDDVFKQCGVLSGGEKIRILFARIFANPPNLLILDEPTTHLDIRARENLQETIRHYAGTVIFVSHDIEFVRNTASMIILVSGGNLKKYYGGYDYYLEKSSQEAADNKLELIQSKPLETDERKNIRKQKAEQRMRLYPLKKELADKIRAAEEHLESLEKEKNELTAMLVNATAGTDFASINRRLKEIHSETSKATSDWEKYSIELENITAEAEINTE